MNTYQMAGEDRVFVLHTDHLAALSEVEGWREGMPPAKDIADLLSYYDGCEGLYLNHGFGPATSDIERFRNANQWLRGIAAKVEEKANGG